jgi:hypothetical protein
MHARDDNAGAVMPTQQMSLRHYRRSQMSAQPVSTLANVDAAVLRDDAGATASRIAPYVRAIVASGI